MRFFLERRIIGTREVNHLLHRQMLADLPAVQFVRNQAEAEDPVIMR